MMSESVALEKKQFYSCVKYDNFSVVMIYEFVRDSQISNKKPYLLKLFLLGKADSKFQRFLRRSFNLVLVYKEVLETAQIMAVLLCLEWGTSILRKVVHYSYPLA